ncbi:MAG: hypothetical protein U0164_19805 [Gemmatimonadaceae bacterium]
MNVRRGVTWVTEDFSADADRLSAWTQWLRYWDGWAEAERPAREALRVFEAFYSLRVRLQRESETRELVLGDGRLLWQTAAGAVDHPVLLQRVEIEFDPSGPELRIVDADRPQSSNSRRSCRMPTGVHRSISTPFAATWSSAPSTRWNRRRPRVPAPAGTGGERPW